MLATLSRENSPVRLPPCEGELACSKAVMASMSAAWARLIR